MKGEKFIDVVPKWLNPYIRLEIINVDKYITPRHWRLQDHDGVEDENRSNQAIENYTDKFLQVVLERTKIYECKTCYFCYTKYRDYRLHLLKHTKPDVDSKYSYQKYGNYVKKFECDHCDLKFVAESTLMAHSEVHRPFPHVCHCGIGFYKKCDLAGHKQLVHPEMAEDVWQPKTKYAGKKAYTDIVVKSEYGEQSEPIRTKLGIFKPKPKLKQSKNKSKREPRKSSAARVILPDVKCEKVEVDGRTKYVCPSCNNCYASYIGIQIHHLTHTNAKPYICDICSKGFTQLSALNCHKLRHAGIKFECPVCHKKLAQKAALSLHMRIHTGEKPYDCEFCGKAFSDPSAFARHIRTHTGEKRYQCPFCPMRFSDASGLIQHKKRHGGQKLHKCDICKKRFFTNYDLVKHLNIHTGLYKYECHDCGRRFASKSTIYTHIVKAGLHSGFQCKMCPRKFNNAVKREAHEAAHRRLGLADCECDLCGETFFSKALIAKHLKIDHHHNSPSSPLLDMGLSQENNFL